ncbi:lytic polysaccharide monooxygenase [Amycolatopsis regifaucium]|uniref:Chitin-binding type-4 domain-containing protein n=1 Tax=Amycolatopsis regifaucium TaxID=546365 RepID=A0A154MEX8_9PSEU|nr:hypothetical protein AVL48_36870 [Amycolatopsis regifaucium]
MERPWSTCAYRGRRRRKADRFLGGVGPPSRVRTRRNRSSGPFWKDTTFYKQRKPADRGNAYRLQANLTGERTGRHLIYSIRQRHWPDSGEPFCSCSDVIFN